MRLSYRGANYEFAPTSVEIFETEQTGQYRGTPYRVTLAARSSVPQSILRYTYRGNDYIGLR